MELVDGDFEPVGPVYTVDVAGARTMKVPITMQLHGTKSGLRKPRLPYLYNYNLSFCACRDTRFHSRS